MEFTVLLTLSHLFLFYGINTRLRRIYKNLNKSRTLFLFFFVSLTQAAIYLCEKSLIDTP